MKHLLNIVSIGVLLTLTLSACTVPPTATPDPSRLYYQQALAEDAATQTALDDQLQRDLEQMSRQEASGPTKIVCADGDGVMLRSDAACQFKTAAGISDGTGVAVLGEASPGCSSVRTPSGSAGYVPSKYLCAASVPTCLIKGNVNFNDGEKIYHLPGQVYYNETVIDPRYGERWFCTEDEARAAGWRKSSQ
jgi:hypothetical protein